MVKGVTNFLASKVYVLNFMIPLVKCTPEFSLFEFGSHFK